MPRDPSVYVIRFVGLDAPTGLFATATIDAARSLVIQQVNAAGIDTENDEWYEIGGRLHYRAPEDLASIQRVSIPDASDVVVDPDVEIDEEPPGPRSIDEEALAEEVEELEAELEEDGD